MLAMAALIYEIWNKRNKIIWRKEVINEAEIIKRVKYIVKIRASLGLGKCKIEDFLWFEEL